MKTNKATVISLLSAMILCIVFLVSSSTGMARETDPLLASKLDAMIADLSSDSPRHLYRNLSSNPYDYIKGNPYYDGIVAMGITALPGLEYALQQNRYPGLGGYLIAAAIEDIAGCNLKETTVESGLLEAKNHYNGTFAWDTSSTFLKSWKDFKLAVPQIVADTLKSSASVQEKHASLARCGLLAVPILLNQQGQGGYEPVVVDALLSLTQGENMQRSAGSFNESIDARQSGIDQWAATHADEIEVLEQLLKKP